MDTGFLNVLHNRADHSYLAVRDAIDINLNRIFQKTINEHGAIWCHFNRASHVAPEIALIINELHRATAQHETGPHQHWVTNLLCNRDCFLGAHR